MTGIICEICGEEISNIKLIKICSRCCRMVCPAHRNPSLLPPHCPDLSRRSMKPMDVRIYEYCDDCYSQVSDEFEEKIAEKETRDKELEEARKEKYDVSYDDEIN